MRSFHMTRHLLAATVATVLVAGPATSAGAPHRPHAPVRRAAGPVSRHLAQQPPGVQRPTTEVLLSIGQGELITLPATVSDVWVSNPDAADVYVSNPRQIHLFGKGAGETTIFATGAGGTVIYATNVRVAQNLTSVDAMLRLAMPEANIRVVTAGQIAVLTGTVSTPEDAAEAQRLVTSMLNPGVDPSSATGLRIQVINRLKAATPLQVNLQVRIAEVSRSFAKNVGTNLTTLDGTSGFQFGVGSGRSQTNQFNALGGPLGIGSTASRCLPPVSSAGQCAGTIPGTAITPGGQRTTLGALTRVLGLDLLGSLDLGETIGQVSTLANPNLTCLSGETCTFLAGGEIPIPIAQPGGGGSAITIEYKSYGIGLAYTATVLSNGHISLRVKPEVSQLSSQGAVQINGTTIPALTTRRAESTLELGSGQSMVIGGLLQNDHQNTIDGTPGLGNIPVLGALFRSNGWRRSETELMIVITPYLVRPVDNPGDIVLPTDGERAPTDAGRILLGQIGSGVSGQRRPVPTMSTPNAPSPTVGATAPTMPQPLPQSVPGERQAASIERPVAPARRGAGPTPGFSN
ncbi:type II and III secretion system protein family protein [Sphingomonas sp.]|uniref:type II and III secretion system protein family protein n=1 Tax=Sphingomonas sp. TaxID=28214 RepID=UPI003CC5A870